MTLPIWPSEISPTDEKAASTSDERAASTSRASTEATTPLLVDFDGPEFLFGALGCLRGQTGLHTIATPTDGIGSALFEGSPARRLTLHTKTHHLGHLLLRTTPECSPFDQLTQALRSGHKLSTGLLSVVGTSPALHGYRGRGWASYTGNLHATVAFAPERPIENFSASVLALGAVATARAADTITKRPGLAQIKWVNDVVVDDRKLGGIIAFSQSEADRVESIVIGIGLNVEVTPKNIADEAVSEATSLADHAREPNDVTLSAALSALAHSLDQVYHDLLLRGPGWLLDEYRERSSLIGRQVRLVPDAPPGQVPSSEPHPPEASFGRVIGFADDLGLLLEGRSDPIRSGRVAVLS